MVTAFPIRAIATIVVSSTRVGHDATGRHRVGRPGLRYWPELPDAPVRATPRGCHRAEVSRRPMPRPKKVLRIAYSTVATLVSLTGTVALAVSAWCTLVGANAVLMMVR